MGFGNFLSKGIAADFKIDMAPIEEARKNQLQLAKDKAKYRKEQKEKDEELWNSLAVDYSKIHPAYVDDAKANYSENIQKMLEAKDRKDVSAFNEAKQRILMGTSVYVNDSKKLFDYDQLDGQDYLKSDELVQALYNNEDKDAILNNYQDYVAGVTEWGTFNIPTVKMQNPASFFDAAFKDVKATDYKYSESKLEGGKRRTISTMDPDEFERRKEVGIQELAKNPSNMASMARYLGTSVTDLTNKTGGNTLEAARMVGDKYAEVYRTQYGDETLPTPKTGRTGGKTAFEKITIAQPIGVDVEVKSKPQMQEVVIGQDDIKKMFESKKLSPDLFEKTETQGRKDLVEAIGEYGLYTREATPLIDEVEVSTMPYDGDETDGKTITLSFDEDDASTRKETLKGFKEWVNKNTTKEQQEVKGEPLLNYKKSVAFGKKDIIDLPIGRGDIITDEKGGTIIGFESQSLPVEVQEIVTDEDGNTWYKVTVFADITSEAINKSTIFDPTLSEGDPGYVKPDFQKTVFIKEDESKLSLLGTKFELNYGQIYNVTRGIGGTKGTKGGKTNNYGI
jgi:RNA polymerase-binding transcription factor DksA